MSVDFTMYIDIQPHPPTVRYLTPPFGLYTALSAQLAGSLRHTHSRLAEFSEEILEHPNSNYPMVTVGAGGYGNNCSTASIYY